jgi:hypothetical protein
VAVVNDKASPLRERFRDAAGYYAFVTVVVTLLMFPWSSTWLEAGVLLAVGVVAAIVYRVLAGKPPLRWNGAAPRNTQLQQPPPAISMRVVSRAPVHLKLNA